MDEIILHQPSHTTFPNRHPDVFAHAKELQPKHVLSFGCSSGEECVSLKEHLPKATIVGAEISEALTNTNNAKNSDPTITFIHTSELKKHAPYDMIFAINVLIRDVEDPLDYPLYIFDYFEKQIHQFDSILKTGGHLVLVHTQHDFLLTEIACRYKRDSHPDFFRKIDEA